MPSSAPPVRCFEVASSEMKEYYTTVHRIVHSRWLVHESLARRHLEVVVSLTVDRDGRVLDYVVEKRSGDRELDRSAIRAVEEVRKVGLPSLPPACGQDRHEFGLIFNPRVR